MLVHSFVGWLVGWWNECIAFAFAFASRLHRTCIAYLFRIASVSNGIGRPVERDPETGEVANDNHITLRSRRAALIKELFARNPPGSEPRLAVRDESPNPECAEVVDWRFHCRRTVYRARLAVIVKVHAVSEH